MIFQITKTTYPEYIVVDRLNGLPTVVPEQTCAEWMLLKASGEVIARGPRIFYGADAEKQARSQIAAAKTAFTGARRTKVEVVER
jgi:hypothetical protein